MELAAQMQELSYHRFPNLSRYFSFFLSLCFPFLCSLTNTLCSAKISLSKRQGWEEDTAEILQRADGGCKSVDVPVCILDPEPPSRMTGSKDGRVIPLQVEALLEVVSVHG